MIYYYHDFIIIRLAQFIMDVVDYSIYEIRNQMIIEKKTLQKINCFGKAIDHDLAYSQNC